MLTVNTDADCADGTNMNQKEAWTWSLPCWRMVPTWFSVKKKVNVQPTALLWRLIRQVGGGCPVCRQTFTANVLIQPAIWDVGRSPQTLHNGGGGDGGGKKTTNCMWPPRTWRPTRASEEEFTGSCCAERPPNGSRVSQAISVMSPRSRKTWWKVELEWNKT